MISFRPYGRLGNFMFMAANCIVQAIKNDEPFSMPYQTNDRYWNPTYLEKLVDPSYTQGREDILINEPEFRYREIEFKPEWKGKYVIFNGYYQSWKYTEGYRDELLYLFGLPYEMKENFVSVHVRRGDYVWLVDKHPIVTPQWYEEQMSKFPNYKFKFFSDDIAYCKQHFGHREDCEFSTNSTEMEDLIEASFCEHNICSSSTFSYWIAWLNRNKNKQCIFPNLWFVEGYHLDTTDLLHPDFIKV